MTYEEFLKGKIDIAEETGIVVEPEAVNPALKPHQRDAVIWALKGGRRALFESFGLGKTAQQLEWARLLHERTGVRVMIVCPLGVKQEFQLDAERLLGWRKTAATGRGTTSSAPYGAPSSKRSESFRAKGEGFWKARRTSKETVLTVHQAAAIIRTAFGKEDWKQRARGSMEAATLVAALWVAQNDSGKERLRDLIGWAWRLK